MILSTNDTADLALAAALTVSPAAVGPLHGAVVHLCTANISYDRTTVLADLTAAEATYDGYAAQDVTWDTPTRNQTGVIEIVGNVPGFIDTGSTTPNQIYGMWVSDTGGTHLYACAAFDTAPIPMINPACQITVTLRWQPTQGGMVAVVS
jgi:hypothetical protein